MAGPATDAPAGDEIAGTKPYCLLQLPWAPKDVVAYCVSRKDLWRVRKHVRPARTYLRVELDTICQATAGESDEARSLLFRRLDRLKKLSGGWIVGIQEKKHMSEDDSAGRGGDDGDRPADERQKPALSPDEAKVLQGLEDRARKAAAYFDRRDVPEPEKRQWYDEFAAILGRIADLRGRERD